MDEELDVNEEIWTWSSVCVPLPILLERIHSRSWEASKPWIGWRIYAICRSNLDRGFRLCIPPSTAIVFLVVSRSKGIEIENHDYQASFLALGCLLSSNLSFPLFTITRDSTISNPLSSSSTFPHTASSPGLCLILSLSPRKSMSSTVRRW
ncbi:hypothetical protein C349_03292 [Cryptococcus neoformans var. grubii Br795]|nr:hypothetical protein C353_03268 [Cryptococcus neoformans var. grubii AD1-83a]OXG59593.1 hypothetical protein C354_03203 [Cryptococcus neoformans var. grubii MW-RSA1955]OXG63885.1 hypothetical protein C351_02993 [Cryptococcus neoformans var. grubii c8]OXG64535.1 hypothetical protein C352_03212 [Cryptococcus neoformans var. grubii CHC193]OXG82944.1 hypothetical protein C349_03292 [Cryptococcus neoformans var. grubii Br795]OXH10758.1 hypothetical protein C369_03244 [Cryptococcus neoformans var